MEQKGYILNNVLVVLLHAITISFKLKKEDIKSP